MKFRHGKLIALLMALLLVLTACGGDTGSDTPSGNVSTSTDSGEKSSDTAATSAPAATSTDSGSTNTADSGSTSTNDGTDTGEGVNKSAGGIKDLITVSDISGINRTVRKASSPMGEDGTWTIFVYLCGSDLESDGFAATLDMLEMMDSNNGKHMKFVVETGGAKSWYNDIVSSDKLSRYVVEDGDMFLIDTLPYANMGESSTLSSFLEWGIKTYPASKMGLIFWNHGSGSINGVCFDEKEDYDSLLLNEVDAALCSVFEKMTDKFEFIGFDACLMSTVEVAAKLATHANYMIASEETEPGSGWDYTAIGKFLEKNPTADGAQLGKSICDSFYDACAQDKAEKNCTLSVTDLSKIDDVILAFRDYAEDVYNAVSSDDSALNTFVRKIYSVDNYGGNNRSEGYANMIDLRGLINAGAEFSSHAKKAADAVNKSIVYMKNGSYHSEAGGLATYYPIEIQGSSELTIFRDICISSYYLGLVDMLAYGFANAGDTDDYSSDDVISNYFDDYTMDFYDWDDGEFYYDLDEDDYMTDLSDVEPTGESAAITFDEEPGVDDDYIYGFILTEEGLMNTASVQAQLYMLSEDEEDIISIGLTTDVTADWSEGIFMDNFDGYWLALPNGEQLNITLVEECDGYDIFTAPILLNGEETNLRLVWDYEYDAAYMIDIWEGIDDNGFASRCGTDLEIGDVIVPLYSAFSIDGDDEFWYYGSEYVFDGDDSIEFALLPDGEYYYAFCIDDIYGDYLITDFVQFNIEDGEVYFDSIL